MIDKSCSVMEIICVLIINLGPEIWKEIISDNRLIEESYQREMMEKESRDEDEPIRPRRRQRQQLNEPGKY